MSSRAREDDMYGCAESSVAPCASGRAPFASSRAPCAGSRAPYAGSRAPYASSWAACARLPLADSRGGETVGHARAPGEDRDWQSLGPRAGVGREPASSGAAAACHRHPRRPAQARRSAQRLGVGETDQQIAGSARAPRRRYCDRQRDAGGWAECHRDRGASCARVGGSTSRAP